MEELPVEIVGDILSRRAVARDVVLASMVCRKWRKAFREHLRALSFTDIGTDRGGFGGLSRSRIETLMSRTILQTTNLQSLIIQMRFRKSALSISVVMSWLMHIKKTLQELIFDVEGVSLPLNVVEICRCEKIEKLTLAHGVIKGVDPNYHQFSSLRSLSLIACVFFSESDLRAMLAASPYLESLELIALRSHAHVVENLTVVAPPILRSLCITHVGLDSLIFESASVEHLHLQNCRLQCFKFIGKGTLTNLTIKKTDVVEDFEICDSAASLESIDITEADIAPSELCKLISKSSKLRELRLWHVYYCCPFWSGPTDLENVAMSCPQLSLLSLGCGLQVNKLFPYSLGGSSRFENLVYLKVGGSDFLEEEELLDEFFDLVAGLLDRCPSLRQLVVSGLNDLKDGIRFSTPISGIRRKCVDSNVQLDFN